MSEAKTTEAADSWSDRKSLLLLVTLLSCTALYLWSNGLYFFASDYLAGFYPYLGYPEFAGEEARIRNNYYQDVSFFFLPFWRFAGEHLANGVLPLWSPLEGAGIPAAGAHALGLLFPLRWFTYGLFSTITAWHIEMSLLFMVGAGSSYYFFKSVTGSAEGSIIGALSWTLAGGLAPYYQQGTESWPLALLPLILLGLEKIDQKKAVGIPMVGFALGCCLLVGHLQDTPAVCLIAFGYAVWKRGAWIKKFIALFLGFLIGLPFLVPVAELIQLCNRESLPPEVIAQNMLAFREYLSFLFPFFCGAPSDGFYLGKALQQPLVNGREHCLYVGQLTFLLGCVGALRARTRTQKLGIALLVLCYLSAASAPIYLAAAKVFPPLTAVTPLRFLPFLHFGVCYLAAVTWKELKTQPLTKNELQVLGGFIIGTLIVVATFVIPATLDSQSLLAWFASQIQQSGILKPPYFEGAFGEYILSRMMNHFRLSSSAIWLPIVLLGSLLGIWIKAPEKYRFKLILLVLLIDLLVYFFSFNIPTSKDKFYPLVKEFEVMQQSRQMNAEGTATPTRVLGLGRGLHPNIPLAYGIANFEVYASLVPGDYRRLFHHLNGEDKKLAHQLASIVTPERLKAGALDLFGVSLLYDHPPPKDRKTEASQLFILPERETALRAFLSNSWALSDDFEAVFDPGFNPRDQVLVEQEVPVASAQPNSYFEEIQPSYYGCNEVQFSVNSKMRALLVLTDLHYPGWTVSVNGDEAPLLKVYGYCRAVVVPEGESRVVFRYRPTGWGVTAPLALLASLLLLVGAALFKKFH